MCMCRYFDCGRCLQKTVANDVCLQKGESHGRMNLQIKLFGHGLTYEAIRASRVDEC